MQVKNVLKALCAAAALTAGTFASAQVNGGSSSTLDTGVGSISGFRGVVVCGAAINSNGSVAGGTAVNADPAQTLRLATGQYQVAFSGTCNSGVLIANGWFRYVQRDTLQIGSMGGGSCITADRAGVTRAIFVHCFDAAGNAADTSFTIMVVK